MYVRLNLTDARKEYENNLSYLADINGLTVYMLSPHGELDGYISDNSDAKQFYYNTAYRYTGLLNNARPALPAFYAESHGTSFFALRTPEGNSVICGPVLHMRTEEAAFAHQLEESKLSVSERIRHLESYKYMPVIDYRRFLELALLFNALINKVNMSLDEMMARRRLYYYNFDTVSFEYNKVKFAREPYPLGLQERIKEAVRSGSDENADRVVILIERWNFSFTAAAPVRGYRLTFAVMAGVIMNEAISCGVDSELAVSLCEYYLNWADRIDTIEELISICIKMLYDYTRRVRENAQSKLTPLTLSFIRYINAHPEEHIVLSHAAEELGITPQYLSVRVKADTGFTPNRLIHKLKIEEAVRLLESGQVALADMWLHLGYCDQSHFIKVFGQITGMTPREYIAKTQKRP